MEIRTAYHEAGHAVMCGLIGLEVLELSIIPNETKSKSGYCYHSFYDDFHPEYFSDAETPEKTQQVIRLLIAGAVCEEIFAGRWDEGADSDLQRAYYLALTMASSDDEIKQIMNDRWREVREIMARNWGTVEKLAGRLIEMKYLHGEQIKTIMV